LAPIHPPLVVFSGPSKPYFEKNLQKALFLKYFRFKF
jgi:hypothetical protein